MRSALVGWRYPPRVMLVAMLLSARPCRAEPVAVAPTPAAPAPPSPRLSLGDILHTNLERSYVTYPIGITGLDPLIFEADLVPNFSILPRSWHVALFLTPKIILRMFGEKSAPVVTPSYMPRLTTFFWFDESLVGPRAYFSAALLHHSNGQSGEFYNADGSHNHETGSFGTNYFEFAAYARLRKTSPVLGWSSLLLEWHPRSLENKEQRSTYGNLRLHFTTTLLSNLGPYAADLSVKIAGVFGDMETPTNASKALARIPIAVKYAIRPPSIDVGFYAAYYQGQDYYNIWYDRFISVFQIGISANLGAGLDP